MTSGGKLSEDMGSRIKRPMGKDINEKWRLWNEASEEYLAQKEGKTGEYYYGRGRPIQSVKNTISAPQDRTDGSAITTELRTQQKMLSRMKNTTLSSEKEMKTHKKG
eukprot:5118465-Heterocapsa_arctica.AAC.1